MKAQLADKRDELARVEKKVIALQKQEVGLNKRIAVLGRDEQAKKDELSNLQHAVDAAAKKVFRDDLTLYIDCFLSS